MNERRPGTGKPIAVLKHVSSLVETLSIMGGRVVPGASLPVMLRGRTLDAAGMAADPGLSSLLRSVVAALEAAFHG